MIEEITAADSLQQYVSVDLCALPALRIEKRPSCGRWKQYQKRLPTEAELSAWSANHPDAVCIICGKVSNHLEILDFDAQGELFDAWAKQISPELLNRLVIQGTPSGGWHVIYRCQTSISGNMKLAQRLDQSTGEILTLIETRGEGGLFLCYPTQDYELAQGDLCDLPVITEAERDALLQAAWDLNEYLPPVLNSHANNQTSARPCESQPAHLNRPGDDFNKRGDVRTVLEEHGWVRTKGGENEYWRRPGKQSGTSATLKENVFYVFSSNATPFEPGRGYSPFAVYAILSHGGDFEQAARSLGELGFGLNCSNSLPDDSNNPDISAIVQMSAAPLKENSNNGQTIVLAGEPAEAKSEIQDPGPIPLEMLRVPGFVSEVMDYCLATAPYPNPVMAFAGALALQAFLGGRKVRDSGNNRTNLYLLGLAHSASGKDWPRKINNRILLQTKLGNALGERFASGEGIQDALYLTPSMLFQTDEIDTMLQSINLSKHGQHEAILSTLLTMYSSANSLYPMRKKANVKGENDIGLRYIDQPNLVIFGTAIPNHYYAALSERMMTNGFFARMIVLEAGSRSRGQEPVMSDLPKRVLETANWWANFNPIKGNLTDLHPLPALVEHTSQAQKHLIETRDQADHEYAKAEAGNDAVGTTVWGRVSEQVRKLSLIYAISENHHAPVIGHEAVEWASEFVMHQVRRMLYMAASHAAESAFHAECLKAITKLREAPNQELAHSVLLKRMKMKAKDFKDLIETLIQRGDIQVITTPRAGSPMVVYKLN
ncbi:hypothetical protein KS4_10760 [Poriferisphaera corsica]|uniref:DNA primase/polymerase bifunctional N-terminal domain-containing protein n=1 Tax=Poriferisphaera corsica TaxID=2528020 RepID=A0A517YS41_9BACT|nr:bifunctional DNA primase/polymerase [Poriferisphaera corsica]QDU33035.1 hypothetical protein KS4_10760 [Poriferisphaera corsica]